MHTTKTIKATFRSKSIEYILWKDNAIWLSMTGNLYQDETRSQERRNQFQTTKTRIEFKHPKRNPIKQKIFVDFRKVVCTLGLTLWNLSSFEFKFDDTRLFS